jgi:hypothetical protein
MSGLYSATANYGGRQPDNTAYIKQFVNSVSGYANWIYKQIDGIKFITTVTKDNVFLPKDLVVAGSITSPSDIVLKENIYDLTDAQCDHITDLMPKQYTYIGDESQKVRYGVIAQDIEVFFPELVSNNTGNKSVNYLELIPIMIVKMKKMQQEIDRLSQERERYIE